MEQTRIEHAPNGSVLTYITIAAAMVNYVHFLVLRRVALFKVAFPMSWASYFLSLLRHFIYGSISHVLGQLLPILVVSLLF